MTSSEDVLLEMPNVKHKKDDGRLYLMSERVAWIQGNKDVVTVSHKYADIKSQKISPEGKPKIQLQIVLHDGTTYTFHFVNPDGNAAQYRDRDQVKELLLQLLPKFKRKVDQELEEKNRLLSENPKLLRLYKDLVIDDIITADEFWTTHAPGFLASCASNSNQKKTVIQETGVSSGFLSGIHPETDGANGLRYNLTIDVIESIFKTYPAVKKKHLECVPAQMTESVFWTKFFQSHYFHRDRLPLLKDLFHDCAKADDKEMRRELEKVRFMRSDMFSVLEDQESVVSDGFLKDTTESEQSQAGNNKDKDAVTPQGIYRNMIKRFNHHSIMVLKACDRASAQEGGTATVNGTTINTTAIKPPEVIVPSQTGEDVVDANGQSKKKKKKRDRDKTNEILENGMAEEISPEVKKAKLAEKIVYEDLANNTISSFTKLNLSRVDRYLNGPVPDFKIDAVSADQVRQTALVMRELNKKWSNCPRLLDSVTAVKILGELRPGGALMKNQRSDNQSHPVTREIDIEIRTLYTSLTEILRHFWSCFPPTTPALEEKLVKTFDTLKKFHSVKMQQLSDKLLRDHMSAAPLLAHPTSMIQAAEAKYDQWLQRAKLQK